MGLDRPRKLAVAAVLALALGLGACGSDGDDGASDATADSAATSSDEREIRATFDRMQKALYAGRPYATCVEMTERARQQFSSIGGAIGTCEERVKELAPGIKRSDDRRPFISKVEIYDDRAIVTTRKTPGRPQLRAPLLKFSDGTWKVDGGWGDVSG